ncbi:MAG: ribonuclease P protein component [Akkermansia sp.]|nr:ribonuclease P protein component [Akkermansia sp.]
MTRAFEFAHVREAGTSVAGRCLVLSAVRLSEVCAPSSFGVICTKKIGCAVVRNLLRRRVRELLRRHGDPWASGVRFAVILRWRAKDASFASLEKDFIKTLRRLRAALPLT